MSEKNIILYVDGGAETPRGIAGWGIHGYSYSLDVPKQGTGRKEICTAIGYIDPVITAQNGLPVPDKVTPLEYVDGIGPMSPQFTNNEAELFAAIEALKYCAANQYTNILLMLDSEYVRKGITEWLARWIQNRWMSASGEPVKNVNHWLALIEAKEKCEAQGAVIQWRHVDGHSGDLGNTLADAHCWRAKYSAWNNNTEPSLITRPAKGYWSRSTDYNRMISHPRWYFNATAKSDMISADGRFIYHLGNHGPENKLWGKPDSETTYSILFLKEKDAVMESVREAQKHFIRHASMDALFIAKLDTLVSTDVYQEITDHGNRFLYPRKLKIDLYTPLDQQLTEEANPPFLANDAVACLMTLEMLLNDYLEKSDRLVITDITDLLYDKTEQKKKTIWKLKPTINDSSLKVDVSLNLGAGVTTDLVNLTVGTDIAKRNTLSALAGLQPKIMVATWRESDVAYRYATIIETSDDVGIWCGYYQNLRLVAPN